VVDWELKKTVGVYIASAENMIITCY